MRLPTIKITDESERGYRTINERDFDPDVHEKYAAVRDPDAERITSGSTDGKPEPVDPDTVDMSDVEALTWPQLRSKASDVSDAPISTKEDAFDAIRAHRAANGGAD